MFWKLEISKKMFYILQISYVSKYTKYLSA